MNTPNSNPDTPVQKKQSPTRKKETKKNSSNQDAPKRKHLTPQEVERLEKAAGLIARSEASRVRNTLMIKMGFLHGLRVSEISKLEWSQIDTDNRRIYVSRLKNGVDTTHPLLEEELRLLGRLRKITNERGINSKYIFLSEEGFSISPVGIRKIIKQAGEKAGFDFHVNPHKLRHACGYALAEKGTDTRTIQDYLGHRDIKCTVIYTQGTSKRFENLFQ